MRAAVVEQPNSPWVFKDLPDPHPAPGQVLIRVRASGMCGADVHIHHGHFPVPLPLVVGHEPVGEIVEIGPGATPFKLEDRVGVCWHQKGCGRCRACRTGHSIYCHEGQTWMNLGGGNSELMLAWAEGCTLLPEGLAYEAAAPVFCAGYTVLSGLRNASPRPGERVAVLGLGGLGHLAVQYSKALGLETFAVTGTEAKTATLRAMGADAVVVAGDHAGHALREVGGADVILATTNSAAHVTQALLGLRPEGRLVNMGATNGPIQVDAGDFLSGQKHLLGSTQNHRQDLVEALEMVASGKVKPAVEVYPLERINEVRDRLDAGKVRYRAVLLH